MRIFEPFSFSSELNIKLISDYNKEIHTIDVYVEGKNIIPEEETYLVQCKGHLNINDIDWEMMKYAFDDDIYHFSQESEIRGVDGGNSIKVIECNEIYSNGGSVLLAPNGKPSNLTPEQYKLVREPAFKKWFGDWEKNPETASKVIDENGEPLVVWHGSKSNQNFNVFKQSSRFEFIYFAKNKYYSWLHFTQDTIDNPFQLKPFFLNIRNLLNAEEFGFENIDYPDLKSFFYGIHDLDNDTQISKSYLRFWQVLRYSNDLFHSLKKQDYYDGISFYENMYESTTWKNTDDFSLTYVVMNPNQIKLADGTNTTFDGNNTDIRFAGGGLVDFSKKEIRKYAENILKDFDYEYVGNSDTN